MHRLAPSAALMTSACAIETQLDTASVSLEEDALQVTVEKPQEDARPTIDSRTAVLTAELLNAEGWLNAK